MRTSSPQPLAEPVSPGSAAVLPPRSLRILVLSPVAWPCVGGSERLLVTIMEGLARRGHRPEVVASDAAIHRHMVEGTGSGLPVEEMRNGVCYRRVRPDGGALARAFAWGIRRRGGWRLAEWLSGGLTGELAYRPSPFGAVVPMMRARADVVLAVNWWSAFPVPATKIARRRGIPAVALPLLHAGRRWASRPALHRVAPLYACTVGLTPSETAYHRALGARATAVIGCGIAPDWGQGADGTATRRRLGLGTHPVIGLVGRQDEAKGVPTLLAAMPRVWAQCPEARLLLAGPSAHRDAATTAALAALAPADRARVVLADDFTEAEAPDLFAACDLLAQPSVEESFGLVLLEAWAVGRPVIGARIPATCDLIDEGEDGLIVPPADPAALSEAILSLVRAPATRAQMGARGQAKVRAQYTTDAMLDAWEALLLRVAR